MPKYKPSRKAASRPPPAPAPRVKAWCVYVLRCSDNSLYCGITNDLEKRLAQHSAGTGARYTRGRAPLILLRSWPVETVSAALKAELKFKALGRLKKESALLDDLMPWAVV